MLIAVTGEVGGCASKSNCKSFSKEFSFFCRHGQANSADMQQRALFLRVAFANYCANHCARASTSHGLADRENVQAQPRAQLIEKAVHDKKQRFEQLDRGFEFHALFELIGKIESNQRL